MGTYHVNTHVSNMEDQLLGKCGSKSEMKGNIQFAILKDVSQAREWVNSMLSGTDGLDPEVVQAINEPPKSICILQKT